MEPIEEFEPEVAAEAKPTSRHSFLRDVPWRWSDIFIGIAPMILARIVSSLITPAQLSHIPHWVWLPATILNMAWMFGYPLLIAWRRQGAKPHIPPRKTVGTEALYALLSLPALWIGLGVIFSLLFIVFGLKVDSTSPLEPIARSPNRFEPIGLAILSILVAPFAEETFFRGMVYNTFRQRLHPAIAMVLQAGAFGFLHPFSFVHSLAASLIGLGLGIVYHWRKTLLTPIMLHSFQNMAAVGIMMWSIAATSQAPWLGVQTEADTNGSRIVFVSPGSPADIAGLKAGDIITTLDGQPAPDLPTISQAVRQKRAGDKMSVEFTRNGQTNRVEATLKKRPR